MRVGVLGGGLQGCCVALALAERGVKVTLFDKNDMLLSRAAVANEGKIHLGYMYAGDPTLSTAKTMMAGALSFAPFLERHLDRQAQSFSMSLPATYVVHCDSQRTPEDVCNYLNTVHELVNEAAKERSEAYFGKDLSGPLKVLSATETETEFNPRIVLAAVSTPEIAINPVALAQTMRDCIATQPRIEVRCNHTIIGAKQECGRITVLTEGTAGPSRHCFDHVVNALWDGRFALNESLGYRANRPWLHRLKYGVSFRLPEEVRPPPSATVVLGPFGEVVTYGDGVIYLTWYPVCLQAISTAVSPPDWDTYPGEPLRSRVLKETFLALSEIVPSLRDLDPEKMPEAIVKGGAIVAWGKTDIYDPASELHRRFEIGVTTDGSFHSVDPGKLTMAPYFAEVCAERICPRG
jgi:glycine/D-amino acid oxidase-like deaminating enzyme